MDARFQVSFTPLAGVLFAFPSRYLFTIGHRGVFRLGEWSPRIRTGFHVSRPNWDPGRPVGAFGYGAVTRCGPPFQRVRLAPSIPRPGPATPESKLSGLACCAFARHYSRNLVLISSPSGTEMFHFPECRSRRTMHSSVRAARLRAAGFPIRIPPDHSLLTTPRSFSQSAASFFASRCQGIRRAPVYA